MKIQRSLQDELESREKNGNHFPDSILLSLFLRICQVMFLLFDNLFNDFITGCQGTPQIFSTFGSQVTPFLYW